MKPTAILLLMCCVMPIVRGDIEETKDLDVEDPEDLERRHRRRKKPHNTSPCGSGYGRTFGFQDYTYVSAPVMNYFFGCGVAPVPVAPYPQLSPAVPYPVQIGVSQSQHHGGHHGGHQGGHHGGHHGGHGGHYGNVGGFNQGAQFIGGHPSGYGQNQPFYGQGAFQPPSRPLQNVVSAAASGFGNVLADYINRPRKTQKQFNRQINQLLKPIYKLF